jgi:hypothetical protein
MLPGCLGARTRDDNTALQWATTAKAAEVVIRHGADVNARNDAGKPAVATSSPAPVR